MESKGKIFRRLLPEEPYVFTGGIYSPLDAQIAERAGLKAIYLSGYSLAMLNGCGGPLPGTGAPVRARRGRSDPFL
jgi:2-methylisocitrate lyase-like PEP mutase family enzyme